ncbi:hypothetical protein FB446DRAFT_280606 [Lentinula raphanica]|nr:hypothetical protein FB446DRAFT_280606 [Lentinula raphanica]
MPRQRDGWRYNHLRSRRRFQSGFSTRLDEIDSLISEVSFLAATVARGKHALGQHIVVMGEDEVDDGSATWVEEDEEGDRAEFRENHCRAHKGRLSRMGSTSRRRVAGAAWRRFFSVAFEYGYEQCRTTGGYDKQRSSVVWIGYGYSVEGSFFTFLSACLVSCLRDVIGEGRSQERQSRGLELLRGREGQWMPLFTLSSTTPIVGTG